ncbi:MULTISPECIES: UvrD-helicase domain-containing protein [unclassified Rhodococcus (in: high G+C Gram-positive bacteria)]|uniref:UvrD-helicase domain-containing protein n=1 Tax=unclassified Rhodococcus (in: high G+C Gram-positive bacteria) TaxID=192944 RepID=UPI00163958DE|nr:UvrD-helicase domain-containing protein [Rhodococcus sp. 3A]MBC2896040.1 UvrD-helicase domain-containing protein [Rhodococcus sp. 4CII]
MGAAAHRRDDGAAVTGAGGFDLLGPLPEGTTVLEANAGTGKTYAIVGLAARFVAEGAVALSQLLLVTFSRAATQELRERTRERFGSAAAALADPAAARLSADHLIRHLADGDAEEVTVRRRRLLQALSDFDAATIVTTHSFCQRMLDGLGIAGERDPDTVLVEAADDLTAEVIDDLYLRAYSRVEVAPFTPAEATAAARAAIFDPQAVLAPEDARGTPAGERVAFAEAVRAEVERRKRAVGLRDFDDLPMLLHRVLSDPAHGAAACRRVRERYGVVLVDEFQDTDPLQWDILRRTFHGNGTLVLVGDPKQAVYAFRGAEVLSYLDAVRSADRHQELTTNWRSDQELLDGLEYLHGGAALGHPEIVVHRVDGARPKSRLTGAAPLRLRYLPRTGAGPLNKSGYPAVGPLRERIAADLAADIVALLDGGATLDVGGSARPVEPGDIAVLVRTNAQIALVHDALDRAGVPSVLAGGASVFTTPAAQHWLWILQAIEQPHRADRVRLAALTPLLGHSAEELDARGDDIVAEVGGLLRELGAVFAQSGFAALFERLSAVAALEARLLRVAAGERALTDLRHVAQLLNSAAVEQSLGLTAVTRWLTERMKDPTSGGVDRSRRLDSDATAVQIATVHASKGLEFPLVYLPYAWDAAKISKPSKLLLHDDDGRRILDVGGPGSPGYADRRNRHDAEEAGEELRLLYVAVTRAMCGLVVWWAPGFTTAGAPLHRMILGRRPGQREVPQKAVVPEDPVVAERLSEWGSAAPETVTVEAVGSEPIARVGWTPQREPSGDLEAARFRRLLDMRWRRTSYSALTASAHDAPAVGSEAEVDEKTDEPDEPPLQAPADVTTGVPSTMNDLPGGATFGTLVHAVFEIVDTAAPDLDDEVLRCCRDVIASTLSDIDPAQLASALVPVLRTPLGAGAGRTLADLAPADLLAELDFELPLAGGDTPSLTVMLDRVGRLLRTHLSDDDPLRSYADAVLTLEPTPLRGYLTGSIDAVLRLPGPRYVVVDYKTNRLAQGELTTAHYTRDNMAAEMLRAHYPLQALLYSVALHRYLRWRQPDYDPAVHLGGVQYLFVRGMVGPGTPPGCGVFDWAPPAALITELSDLLSGSASEPEGTP